jgi:hypothetical protein
MICRAFGVSFIIELVKHLLQKASAPPSLGRSAFLRYEHNMKSSSFHSRILARMALLIALASIFAGCKKTDDLTGYRKLEADAISAPVVANPGFEEGLSGWTAGGGFQSAPGQGTQQTRALYYERTNPDRKSVV